MTASGMVSALSTLGTTGVLLIVLVFLLTKATEERKNITEKFLSAMQDIAKTNAEGPIKLAVELHEHSSAVRELTNALRDFREFTSREHDEMMQTIRQWADGTWREPVVESTKLGA